MKKDEIYEKIDELEKKRMAYLEVDNKASANRIRKQIEKLETQLEILELNKIKKELNAYKTVIRDYPALQNKVKEMLEEF